MYANLREVDVTAELERYKAIREKIRPCVKDATLIINELVRQQSKNIIVEGANAAMLDIDFGNDFKISVIVFLCQA